MNKEQWVKKVEQLGFTVVKTRGDYLEAELRDLKRLCPTVEETLELAHFADAGRLRTLWQTTRMSARS